MKDGIRILVTGSNGMLGHAVVKVFLKAGCDVTEWDLPDGDLSNEDTARRAVFDSKAATVVNCAAFADVEGCEDEQRAGTVEAANVLVPRFLARAAKAAGARLVHISTDYVFDGDKPEPYLEDDPVGPVSAYGKSKLAGERAVIEEYPDGFLILRTAWLYGAHGKNFVDTILNKSRSVKKLNVVNDQRGCPTYAQDLAEAVCASLNIKGPGIFHAVGSGRTTWFGLARKIIEILGIQDVEVAPCATSAYPTKATRPKNSILSTEKFFHACGYQFRPWEDALKDYLSGRDSE